MSILENPTNSIPRVLEHQSFPARSVSLGTTCRLTSHRGRARVGGRESTRPQRALSRPCSCRVFIFVSDPHTRGTLCFLRRSTFSAWSLPRARARCDFSLLLLLKPSAGDGRSDQIPTRERRSMMLPAKVVLTDTQKMTACSAPRSSRALPPRRLPCGARPSYLFASACNRCQARGWAHRKPPACPSVVANAFPSPTGHESMESNGSCATR